MHVVVPVDIKRHTTPHHTLLGHQVKKKVQKLVQGLEQAGKASYLNKLLLSNNCQPVSYDKMHDELPSKKRFTGAHNSGSKLNDTNIRDKVLEQLKSISGFNAALVPDEQNMMYVEDNLKVAHEGVSEIEERNSREQSDSDVWYAERSKRVTASNFDFIMKRRKKKSILHPYLRM